ncbi:MAG: universal stress protein [Alphaproteobacteria bacterium]|nr:universal stress protein [Alphaproteobacteria bacterium]
MKSLIRNLAENHQRSFAHDRILCNRAAQNISLDDRPVAVALQESALRAGANMLVMGAFGHSRIRDFILGGATKGVLADLRMPVLLSH